MEFQYVTGSIHTNGKGLTPRIAHMIPSTRAVQETYTHISPPILLEKVRRYGQGPPVVVIGEPDNGVLGGCIFPPSDEHKLKTNQGSKPLIEQILELTMAKYKRQPT